MKRRPRLAVARGETQPQPPTTGRRQLTIEELTERVDGHTAETTAQTRMSDLGCLRSALAKAGRHEEAAAVRQRMDVIKLELPPQAPRADRDQPKRERPPEGRRGRKGERRRGDRGRRGRGQQLEISEEQVSRLNDELDQVPDSRRAEILGKIGHVRRKLGQEDLARRAYAAMEREKRSPGCTRRREHDEREQPRREEPRPVFSSRWHAATPKAAPAPQLGGKRAERRRLKKQAAATAAS